MQPSNLGRYQIIRELGRGAMGQVFLAHDPRIDRKVAIKTLQMFDALPESEREEARERFLREARSAGKLHHPGIVTVYDVVQEEGRYFLAMEFVEGETLDVFCKPDRLLPIDTVVEIVARVAEALDYAHRADVVHRDIKPANLMRVGSDTVKIMDFGLAKASAGQLTQDGSLLGTPNYMSPEQIRGKTVDGRSDLFSLAVVLFEMLTGKKPFPGDSISSIMYRIVNEEALDPGELHQQVSAPFSGFLRRALAKNPSDRFPDGRAFGAALRSAGKSAADAPDLGPEPAGPLAEVATEIPAAAPAPSSRRRRSSMVPLLFGMVILLGALAGGAWVFRDPLGLSERFTPPPPPEIWLEARVETEPPGVPVSLDGEPLDPEAGGLVRFLEGGPYGELTATSGCRSARHSLGPADAGGEIVLLLDPDSMSHRVELPQSGVSAKLNGNKIGSVPLDLQLDLCRDNELTLSAAGHRTSTVVIPAAATPLQARSLLAALEIEPLPKGRLVLPPSKIRLAISVDGRRLADGQSEIELTEGSHTLRLRNSGYWIDVTRKVKVAGGETVTPSLDLPGLTELVVQAFPANCKVELRKPKGKWKYVDEAPMRKQVAVGRYEVRVTHNTSNQSEVRQLDLKSGKNPDVRVSFARGQ